MSAERRDRQTPSGGPVNPPRKNRTRPRSPSPRHRLPDRPIWNSPRCMARVSTSSTKAPATPNSPPSPMTSSKRPMRPADLRRERTTTKSLAQTPKAAAPPARSPASSSHKFARECVTLPANEVLSNVGDEAVNQAATLVRIWPSWKVMSLATSMSKAAPSRVRQRREADSASLKSIVRHALRVPLSLERR